MTFTYEPPEGLQDDSAKATTRVTEQPVGEEPVAQPPVAPEPTAQPARARSRRTWLDLLETRMPALGAQRLPSTATVRAYHQDGSYVPFESDLLRAICRLHGAWVAFPWCFFFTCMAWLGAGDYRRRLRKFRREGLPGLYRSQLPPLDALHGFPRVWVGIWSAVAWSNLKITRLPVTLGLYVLPATGPFWWPPLWSLLRPIITGFLSIFSR
ncbi:hypothetical protein [Nonomuraea sp. SYSU D8015]|uniref:hypothetical protein n=1 Tax=Nonomuraea sp. SYSU D8015 TaxID=2593644 RepID=UPI0016600867|nr:hypothetical protein [Nonomuraea sp. SYSU D8015]